MVPGPPKMFSGVQPATAAQVNYIRVIGARLGIEVPNSVPTSKVEATLWLDQYAPQLRDSGSCSAH